MFKHNINETKLIVLCLDSPSVLQKQGNKVVVSEFYDEIIFQVKNR